MWSAIRKDWDYLTLTFLLGIYLTAGVALVITVWVLSQSF
jgi:hypothetical protein